MLLLPLPGCFCSPGWQIRGSGLADRGDLGGWGEVSAYFIQLQIHRFFICLNQIQPFDFPLEDLRTEHRQVSLCHDLEVTTSTLCLQLCRGQEAGGLLEGACSQAAGTGGARARDKLKILGEGVDPKEAGTRAGEPLP